MTETSALVVVDSTALVWSGRASVHAFVVCEAFVVAHDFVVRLLEIENLSAVLVEEIGANLVDAGFACAVGERDAVGSCLRGNVSFPERR